MPFELDPAEAYLLKEIALRIENGAEVPKGFVVYLNDRGGTHIPEDVSCELFRQQKAAFNDLVTAVTELTTRKK